MESLSPLSVLSSHLKDTVSNRRRSAGTMFPVSRKTRSPTTSSRESICWNVASRSTLVRGEDISFSASSAFSLRYCCMTPISALRAMTATMIPASTSSRRNAEMNAPASRMMIIGSRS